MASITSLPNEIIDMALEELPFSTIRAISKTCQKLRWAVLPRIYRVIELEWDGTLENPKYPSIKGLLCTLIEQPEIAKMVKAIALRSRDCEYLRRPDFWGPDYLIVQADNIDISGSERQLFASAIDDLELEQAKSWKNSIRWGASLCTVASLVIAQCSNLESLTMSIAFLQYNRFSQMLTQAYRSKKPYQPLSKLSSIEFINEAYGDDWRIEPVNFGDGLQQLVSLDRLSSMDLTAVSDNLDFANTAGTLDDLDWPGGCAPTIRYLTTLHLRRTQVSPKILGGILERCPNLAELRYDCFKPSCANPLDLGELRAGLEHVRSSIEHLIIRFEVFESTLSWAGVKGIHNVVKPVSTNRLGSLKSLTKLKSLAVSFALLFGEKNEELLTGHDLLLGAVLPGQIEKLTIYDDMWGTAHYGPWEGIPLVQDFEKFFKDPSSGPQESNTCSLATPKLKDFVFDIRERMNTGWGYWKDHLQRDRLILMCQAQDVNCTVMFPGGVRTQAPDPDPYGLGL